MLINKKLNFVVTKERCENEKKKRQNKFLHVAIELQKLWNMKVVVVGLLETVPNDGKQTERIEDLRKK